MRGILIHSLMARGLTFDVAFETANQVRDDLRGRSAITRMDLKALVRDALGGELPGEDMPPPVPMSIRVVGPEGDLPFSKGLLSQSLLAAALEPNHAFDVARELEVQLHRHGYREISRRELRRLTFETLMREVGPQAAERYLVWRKYQDPERPVILLLGGTAGAGKTSLAIEVAHRLGVHRVLSTDAIRQVMRIMLSPALVPAIHASSYEAHRMLPEAPTGEDPVVRGFLAQASIVSVGARAMLDRAVEENTSLVLDGVSIVPGLIDPESYADRAHVIFLVVATLDESAFRSRFAARAVGSHRPSHHYVDNLAAILRIQEYILEQAERFGVPIVDNRSFDRSVLSILRHVTETLRKREPLDVAALL